MTTGYAAMILPSEWESYLRYVSHPLSEPIGFDEYLLWLADVAL